MLTKQATICRKKSWCLWGGTLLCVMAQRMVVIPYRRIGTTGPIFKGQDRTDIGFPITSVRNYHHSLRNTPEARRFRLLRGRSLISRTGATGCFPIWNPSCALYWILNKFSDHCLKVQNIQYISWCSVLAHKGIVCETKFRYSMPQISRWHCTRFLLMLP
jgi:hypothetical protein